MAIGEFLRQRRKDRVERSASAGGWKGDGVAKLVGMLFGPVREAGQSVQSIFSRPAPRSRAVANSAIVVPSSRAGLR